MLFSFHFRSCTLPWLYYWRRKYL